MCARKKIALRSGRVIFWYTAVDLAMVYDKCFYESFPLAVRIVCPQIKGKKKKESTFQANVKRNYGLQTVRWASGFGSIVFYEAQL